MKILPGGEISHFWQLLKFRKSTGVPWTDVYWLMQSSTLMVATHFQTLHDLTIIIVLPPWHVSNLSKSCCNRHPILNLMESIDVNAGVRQTRDDFLQLQMSWSLTILALHILKFRYENLPCPPNDWWASSLRTLEWNKKLHGQVSQFLGQLP